MDLNEKNFLNVDELSEYLDASLSTVYKLAQNGEIPAQKLGRQWRFSREKIDEWIAAGRSESEVGGIALATPKRASESSGVATIERESFAAKSSESDLSAIFSEDQLKTLRAFSLDSPKRLLTTLATATGRKGLEKLLELSPKALDEIATKLVAQM